VLLLRLHVSGVLLLWHETSIHKHPLHPYFLHASFPDLCKRVGPDGPGFRSVMHTYLWRLKGVDGVFLFMQPYSFRLHFLFLLSQRWSSQSLEQQSLSYLQRCPYGASAFFGQHQPLTQFLELQSRVRLHLLPIGLCCSETAVVLPWEEACSSSMPSSSASSL